MKIGPLAVLGGLAVLVGGGAWAWRQQARELAVARAITGGDPGRAPALLIRYGCAGCHTVPGVPGADGRVGPPLGGLRARVYIAGSLPNDAGNLLRWITNPTAISPRTAMPVTGISEAEARDVAAYLYSR